jgi:hypothetical protein
MQAWQAVAIPLMLVALAGSPVAQGFRFSEPSADDEAAQQADDARAARIADDLSTPCRAALRDKKIMVVIGERRDDGMIVAEQRNYGPHFEAINRRLRALGLRTYTPAEIRRQVAQAEIDAYFRNDPDAALSASRRLGASFVLRGLISSQSRPNPMMAVNQVSVDMDFTLTASNGRAIADERASAQSYAGADVARMALTLVNEKADEVVPALYAGYCRNAAPPATRRQRPH